MEQQGQEWSGFIVEDGNDIAVTPSLPDRPQGLESGGQDLRVTTLGRQVDQIERLGAAEPPTA